MKHLYRKVFFLFTPPALLFIVFIFVNIVAVKGQTILSFSTDTIYLQSSQTTLLKARIRNATVSTQQYHLELHSGSFQSILSLPDSLIVASGDSTVIPLLLLAPRKAAGGPHPFRLTITSNGGVRTTAHCILLLKEKKRVYATVARREIYIAPQEDSLHLSMTLHNAGNTAETMQLTINERQTGRLLRQLIVDLPAFADTLLSISLPAGGSLRQLAVSTLVITGRYLEGDVFSTSQIQIFNTNSRKIYKPTTLVPPAANSLGMYAHFMGSRFSYFEWVGKGLLQAGKNQLAYQLGALYYPSAATAAFVLRNTYLNYSTDRWQIQAGNLYQNEEIFLSGRGLSMAYKTPTAAKWEIGYLNNTYNVVGSFRETPYNSGHSIFARYMQPKKNKSAFSGLIVQQWDPFYKGNSSLGGSKVDLTLAPQQHLQLGVYSSYHFRKQNQKDSTGKWGGAMRIHYRGIAGHWQMVSFNYISSPHYAGSAKGAVNLRETIRFTPVQNSSLWARYSNNSSHTTYLYADSGFFNPFYSNETAELGFRRNLQSRLSAAFRLYHRDEQATYQTATRQTRNRIRALHLESTWNYTSSSGKGLYLQMDGGWSASDTNLYSSYLAWKAHVRYRIGAFSFHGNYQNGPYYSGELAFNESGKKYGLFQAGPAFNGSLFKSKITLYANSNVTWEKMFGRWAFNNTINLKWHLPGHFEAELNYNRIRYLGFGPWTDLLDLGIIKKFNGPHPGKQYTLTLHLFEDRNGNYRPDFGEKPVAGQLVQLNQALFRTDASGTVVYKKLPEGHYHISLLQPDGLIAGDTTLHLNHKTVLYMPMHEMRMITGTIELHKQAYSYPTDGNIMGICIVATDPVGNQFKTRTDAQGHFSFSLPTNSYTLALEIESLPDSYTCPQPQLSISLLRHQKAKAHFDIFIHQRKTEVKQFFSPSLSTDH